MVEVNFLMSLNLKYLVARLFCKLRLKAIGESSIDKTSKIGGGSQIWKCNIDRYSYCGQDCTIIYCQIGAFCSIADNVKIGLAAHPVEYISMSPAFLVGPNILRKNFSLHQQPNSKKTCIGNDVWIGRGAMISAGVKVGDGAVIAMGSVVTKNVEPYTIVGGVPAQFIRNRFEENICAKIAATKWWSLTEKELACHSQFFNDPDLYLKMRESL